MARARSRRPEPLIDIGHSSLKLSAGGRSLELPIERAEGGSLTAASRETVVRELRAFLGAGPGRPRSALCALPARGVSLRRLRLPAAGREETARLLALQVEREFPLPADRLALGYARNGQSEPQGGNGNPPGQEVLVAALRSEVLEEYLALLGDCGLRPVFALGALSGSALCPRGPGPEAVLDIGRAHSELVVFEGGVASSVRSLPWGGENATRAVEKALGIERERAEELKRRWSAGEEEAAGEEVSEQLAAVRDQAARELARCLRDALPPGLLAPAENGAARSGRLYLLGGGARLRGLAGALVEALGGGVHCEAIEAGGGEGSSAVLQGLERELEREDRDGAIRFLPPERGPEGLRQAPVSRARLWAGAAAVLAVIALGLQLAAPAIRLPRLERTLAAARAAQTSAPAIDRELLLLEHLDSSRAPYLEVLAALAGAAPPGTMVQKFSMNRQGEVSLRGMTSSGLEANSLRGKLIASGWFSQVVIDDQTPTKDRKQVEFGLSARWRAGGTPAAAASPPGPVPSPPAPPERTREGAAVPSPLAPPEASRAGTPPPSALAPPGGAREGTKAEAAAPSTPPAARELPAR